jgi:O-antigen ligase
MIQIAEIALALACWIVALVLFLYIMPIMREKHSWHVMGVNVFGMFAGYLGCEVITDSAWINEHYSFYLIGNALFPLAGIMITYSYWQQGRKTKKD